MHGRDAHVAIVRRPHVRAIGHANRAYEVFRRYRPPELSHLMMLVPNRELLGSMSTDHLNGGPWSDAITKASFAVYDAAPSNEGSHRAGARSF